MGLHTCTAVACSLCVRWAFLYFIHFLPKKWYTDSYRQLGPFSTDFQHSFTGTLWKIRDNTITRSHHTQNASFCYVVKYKFSKIALTEAQQRQTKRQISNMLRAGRTGLLDRWTLLVEVFLHMLHVFCKTVWTHRTWCIDVTWSIVQRKMQRCIFKTKCEKYRAANY